MTKLITETRRCGEETSEHRTTEARRHGERSGDREIGKSGDRKNELTAEARRRGENHKESVFSDHSITRSRAITRSPSAPGVFRRIMRTIRATLREIFDESAYDRFLLRAHASRSVTSYREFMRERDADVVKKPRCC